MIIVCIGFIPYYGYSTLWPPTFFHKSIHLSRKLYYRIVIYYAILHFVAPTSLVRDLKVYYINIVISKERATLTIGVIFIRGIH